MVQHEDNNATSSSGSTGGAGGYLKRKYVKTVFIVIAVLVLGSIVWQSMQ